MRSPALRALLLGLGLALFTGAPATGQSREATLELVDRYAERFRVVDDTVAGDLGSLYAEAATLEDPIARAEGLDAIRAYLEHFAQQSSGARFEVSGAVVEAGQAAVFWTMVFPESGGEPGHRVPGVSHLRTQGGEPARIVEQRDYFDLGQAVYHRVPVVGWLLRRIDSRLEPDLAGEHP